VRSVGGYGRGSTPPTRESESRVLGSFVGARSIEPNRMTAEQWRAAMAALDAAADEGLSGHPGIGWDAIP
jgi:hypothetical protein